MGWVGVERFVTLAGLSVEGVVGEWSAGWARARRNGASRSCPLADPQGYATAEAWLAEQALVLGGPCQTPSTGNRCKPAPPQALPNPPQFPPKSLHTPSAPNPFKPSAPPVIQVLPSSWPFPFPPTKNLKGQSIEPCLRWAGVGSKPPESFNTVSIVTAVPSSSLDCFGCPFFMVAGFLFDWDSWRKVRARARASQRKRRESKMWALLGRLRAESVQGGKKASSIAHFVESAPQHSNFLWLSGI